MIKEELCFYHLKEKIREEIITARKKREEG